MCALAALVADYVSGLSASQVADKYGVSLTTVLDRLRKAGVTRPLGKVTPEDVVEMARLRQAGWTYREIGERYGVTRHAVAMRLSRMAE